MRLVSFNGARVGVVDRGLVIDVTELVAEQIDDRPEARMRSLIERWEMLRGQLDPGRLTAQPASPLDQVRLEAPLPFPGKVVAAPVNYFDHQGEMKVDTTVADLGVFLKATSSVIGPQGVIQLPYTDRRTDQEGELAVVIGAPARHVTPADALEYVFGYTCLLDITVRGSEDRSTRKSFDTFTPIGPWIATAEEVDNPGFLELRCWVNDELRQQANTKELIVGVPELIAYTSSVMTLHPGDIIATGTPAGVGPLTDGDQVTVEIDRVGRLEVSISTDTAVAWDQTRLRPGARLDSNE